MKRCPKCNRAESDDSLAFCRADGTRLLSDSGFVSESAGTLKLDSAPVAGEAGTRILPQQGATTDEALSRDTAPTTMLDRQRLGRGTQQLGEPKSRRVVVIVAALIAVALTASAYLYLSRGKSAAAKNSVAVLPFENASGDPNMEYLSDGVTESLINSLSQLPNLAVKARSTVFRYKGKDAEPQKVGSELNVQAVLNGRVVQRGDDLTLSLELVDAGTGDQMWGEQYNRKLTDLVALQNEIARDVSNKLRTKLSGADEQKLAKSYTGNSEAYQLYLKGRFHWNKRTRKDTDTAIEYFQQAIAIDPNYALAYAGLADSYALAIGGTPREQMVKAREAASKALSLDENLAEAHAALARVLSTHDYDFKAAERECLRAIELNPNYATAYQRYGELLSHQGRWEESFAQFRRALEIEPFTLVLNSTYGIVLIFARRYDEADTQLKKALELDANFGPTHNHLSLVYQLQGKYAESIEERAKSLELFGEHQMAAAVRESFTKGGWQEFLRAMTGEAKPSFLSFFLVAAYHAELGEKEKAFASLNKSYEDREVLIAGLKVDPRLDPLRSDPRFAELMRKVGLP